MAKPRKPAKDKPETVEDAVVVDEPKTAKSKPDDRPTVTDTPEQAPEAPEKSDPPEAEAPDGKTPDAEADVVPSKDDLADPQPDETTSEPSDTSADTPAARGGSVFMPLLLGGAVAAALGFGAARYPDQWPFARQPDVDPVEVKLTELGDRVSGIEEATTSQGAALTALQQDTGLDELRGELTGQLDQIRVQYEAMSQKLTDLENRVHTVEKLPQGSGMEAAAAAAAAYERELQQMRQMLDAELERISAAQDQAETLEVSAAEAAKAAAARAAMSRVLAALESGQPYGDALFDLTENAGVEAPDALSAHAADGIITLATLQARFPEAARAALDASIRAAVKDGEMDRVTAFFRTQLGARSLEPKEGDDPDAILSRAEAALKDGRIAAALSELEAMPEAGKAALSAWIADATARKDTLEAAQALAQHVNSK
ncbi:hypothetical protein MUY21_10520 [Aliiroseovarius sp. S2029]|uniref:hypothetical protein n=1 Tax=Aliiroseovarius sp. S2029 TaxID=2936988 RepID=UPI0020BD91C0|nr:hypothetical protein [Aliiroseovarius sp. S2029]MCK8484473.1 hypothetical protein [Aliiroseovarius sp. S2029]